MRLTSSSRSSRLRLDPAAAWVVVACGESGSRWYVDAAPLLFRGAVDRLVGGEGGSRPPPDRPLLVPGDRVGLWQVGVADGRVLELEAQVRAPGRVTLRSEVAPGPDGGSRLRQRVTFTPSGLLGTAYLLADLPAREAVIELVHRRLLRDLRAAAATDES